MRKYPKLSETPDKYDYSGEKQCRNCENKISEGRRHYCSQKCMEDFNRNNRWKFVRKDVLRRDKYRCSICGIRFKKSELDVDHIIPLQMHGQLFDKDNLRTLCRECHRAKSKLDKEALDGIL